MDWDCKSMLPEELKILAAQMGEKPFRASQLFGWIHEKNVCTYDEMTNLPAAFRQRLEKEYPLVTLECVRMQVSKLDGTRKSFSVWKMAMWWRAYGWNTIMATASVFLHR